MSALLYISTPIEPPLTTSGVVCCCCLRLALCRSPWGAWRCDDCALAGITPERAHAERQARARLIPPTKISFPPIAPKRERFKRHGKPPIFLTAEGAHEYEVWKAAHPLEAVERKRARIPGEREQPVADECGLLEVYDD
jgi:hypothetical protein